MSDWTQLVSLMDFCAVYYTTQLDREAFEDFLCRNNAEGNICIVFGGFYKLPGLGSMAEICYYGRDSKDAVVQIPYERMKENWYIELFKML